MRSLRLDDNLARALASALLTVARADGVVNDVELAALRGVLDGVASIDDEALLFSDVGPAELRAAIDGALSAAAPYRKPALSERSEVVGAFLMAAQRVAASDGDVSDAEAVLIEEFATALGAGAAKTP